MANRISILVALEGADEGLKRAINNAERSLGGFGISAKSASDKAAAGVAEVKAGMNAFGDQVAKAKTQLLAFLTLNWAAGKVQEIVQIADAWNMMSARLKLATAGQREYTVAQKELFAIAQRIGVPIQETATLYGKLQQAVRMLGGEQKDALSLTESISQALRISGASATEAQSSLLQFGQALASGVLRGEEFNSVVENSPRLAKALADGLNVPIGRLRKLAEEGRLTADVVVNALMSQKDKLAAEYAQLPVTVSQAFTRLSNAFGQWISKLDESTGFTKKLAEALTWLSENLDTVMKWLGRIAEVGLAVLVYRLIPALIIAWQTAGAAAVTSASTTAAAWATANLSLSNAIATVGKLRVAFGVLGAAIIGWEIGTWLSEKFEIVRKAGIFMVEVLMKGIEHLRFQWEVFAAIFTSDTIAEATKRHEQRLAEMNRIFAEMYADATEGANAAKGAMNTAATAAEEIAKRLEAVRQGTQEAVGRGIEAVHAALEKLKSRLGEVEQAVGKAQGVVNDATAKMAEAYKGLTSIVEASLAQQVQAVKNRYDQEKAELDRTQQSETARITKSTQLLTEALTQQATLRRQATTETLGLIDQETQARKDAAARQGQTEEERRANVQRVENDTYVGVVPLTQTANVGDFTIKGASIYTQLVPSAQTETPISFVPPYAAAGLPVPGAASVSYTASHAWNTTLKFNLPGGCLPGSLSIVTDGVTIFDDAGLLKTASGTLGTIDYANGILSLNSGSMSNSKSITYTPAASLQRAPQSSEIAVTPESRSQSYVGTVNPVPQPGTLSISYMAQGRWYVLSDGGNGSLKGLDASYGAGTFNKNTGAFVVTLGALPDVGSSLILTWNVPTQETQQPTAALKASQALQLAPPEGKSVQPGTLTITWPHESGTGTRTAYAATSGTLSGAATGNLNVAQNLLSFAPNVLPPVGALLTVDYVAGPKQEDSFAHPSRDGQGHVPVTATLGSIEPGSLEIEWNTLTDTTVLGVYTQQQIQAMGLGLWNLVDPSQYARDDGAGNVLRSGVVIGSVDYATGAVQFQPDVTLKIPRPVYGAQRLGWASGVGQMFRLNYGGISYVDAPSMYPNDESGYVKLRYNSAGSTSNHSETFAFSPSFRLVPGVNAQVVTGTLLLAIAGSQPWGDNGQGTLREFTPSGWVTRGSINYLSGAVTLTSWSAGATNSITRASCVTTVGENISSEYVFRTGAAPLRPGSLSIQFARAVGGTQTVTAGIDGTISASGVSGNVDYDTGLVRVRFGTVVTAAGNETEPWFDAENVRPDGKIFRPEPVAASSLRYSAVAYSYLPLDAALLGIDPVRLPSDGRVPIFRPGGFAVVGHTGRITASVSNGQTIDTGRVRLSRVRVVGHDGVVIHTGYITDLEAGTVTFTNVTGYSQPVTIEHRIEDMAVVRDVQINGEISFTRPLTHAYPLASPGDPVSGSFVSSALVAGDLFARVNLVFDQSTWNGSWSDELTGSAATATFNHTQYPITVTNRGALTERWVVRMTNSTSFEVIGENVGVIATGNTSADCAPNNPAAGVPYFRLPALGWGNGWATGNVLRFNTIGSQFPVWVVRTVQQGPESVPDDHFTLLIRGDVDTP